MQDHMPARVAELVEAVAADTPLLDHQHLWLFPRAIGGEADVAHVPVNVWASSVLAASCSILATAAWSSDPVFTTAWPRISIAASTNGGTS